MRFLRFLFGALFAVFALVAGLATAAVVALAGALIFAVRRLLRHTAKPVGTSGHSRPVQRRRVQPSGDVIEVSATEVPVESSRQ